MLLGEVAVVEWSWTPGALSRSIDVSVLEAIAEPPDLELDGVQDGRERGQLSEMKVDGEFLRSKIRTSGLVYNFYVFNLSFINLLSSPHFQFLQSDFHFCYTTQLKAACIDWMTHLKRLS